MTFTLDNRRISIVADNQECAIGELRKLCPTAEEFAKARVATQVHREAILLFNVKRVLGLSHPATKGAVNKLDFERSTTTDEQDDEQ